MQLSIQSITRLHEKAFPFRQNFLETPTQHLSLVAAASESWLQDLRNRSLFVNISAFSSSSLFGFVLAIEDTEGINYRSVLFENLALLCTSGGHLRPESLSTERSNSFSDDSYPYKKASPRTSFISVVWDFLNGRTGFFGRTVQTDSVFEINPYLGTAISPYGEPATSRVGGGNLERSGEIYYSGYQRNLVQAVQLGFGGIETLRAARDMVKGEFFDFRVKSNYDVNPLQSAILEANIEAGFFMLRLTKQNLRQLALG